ncbi:MAG: iron-sulfur cluster assembly accessory protein [Deltaproteobacteria bacterium]|nr:iron-sulfur cluster assembly accessory protein [Deltaproteobacteria bacterium]
MAELKILSSAPTEPTGTLTLTDAVADGARRLFKEQGAPEGAALRVGVRGGGCSGFSYVIEAETAAANPSDYTFDVRGLEVRVDKKSMMVLQGCTLDYKVGLMDAGFKFTNPRAVKTCGCGESFSLS